MNPTIIPLFHNYYEVLTPKGWGLVHFLLDYGRHHNPVFMVRLHETGDLLCFDMTDVKPAGDPSYGIPDPKEPDGKSN